jgi:hypothetical protein
MCVLSKHGGVFLRRLGLVLVLLAAIAAARSTNVIAMEEQRGAVPGGASVPDAPKAQEQDQSLPGKGDSGTEIRIPGLGRIGTLPKMDFGLDLLYGAAEDDKKPEPEFTDPQDGGAQRDMMIHGSVKHRF